MSKFRIFTFLDGKWYSEEHDVIPAGFYVDPSDGRVYIVQEPGFVASSLQTWDEFYTEPYWDDGGCFRLGDPLEYDERTPGFYSWGATKCDPPETLLPGNSRFRKSEQHRSIFAEDAQ